ncbi:transient receptor potential cation channel subfamily A member 1 homolog [Mytilus californianus]|uniref:transient receptor potential cation channel subfamily A member 1 homolog n=1 Tax=Mytilus californianus TaxID=6549 RepID=UPI00224564CC|nr:transient receptor potential cation channel subfamily A member 1 homolog [Mytilus californianus]
MLICLSRAEDVMYPVSIYKLKMLKTCLFQCCIISLVITSTLATGTIARVKRCPTRAERSKFVSQQKCKPPEVYHCLIDDEDKFVETCNEFIQLPPGNYPRYTSFSERIYYDPCPHSRFQPWPVKSYEITECEVEKSSCTGIGQVPCSDGSITEDSTCSCDYKNGYVMTGPDKCCSPAGDDDCFCKYHPCQSDLQELDSDYKCVDKCNPGYYRPLGQNSCEDIQNSSYTSDTTATIDNMTTTTSFSVPGKDGQTSLRKSVLVVIVTGFVVCPTVLLVIVIWGEVWRPYKYKLIPLLMLFAWLLSSFVIVTILVEYGVFTIAAKIGTTMLVISVVLGTVYVVYIFSTHEIVKPRLTYDEYYEVLIYKLLKAASQGDLKMLKRFANQRYIDMYDTDYDNRSALHLAACQGHYKAVEYLLNSNAGYPKGIDRCIGFTAADDADWHLKREKNIERRNDFERIIGDLKNHKSSQKVKHHFRDTIALKLIKAAENGDVEDLKSLHNLDTDMNLSDSDGRTALHAATEKKQEAVINFLIDQCNVSPFVRWRDQRPVELIKDGQDNQKLKDMLSKYMEQQLNPESTVTHNQSEDEDFKIVRILNSASRGDIRRMKAYKAEHMTVSDYDKRTALHIAVSNNQEHIVEYLLKDCGMTEEVQKAEDRWKRTPLMVAKEKGRGKIFKLFLTYCPNLTNTENDEYKTFSLLMAGNNGDVETLKRLYDSGVSMNMQDYDGRTALHLAVDEWKEDAMNFLIATCNCNRNITDRYGHTADISMNKNEERLKKFEEKYMKTEEPATVKRQSSDENETNDVKRKINRVNFMNRIVASSKSKSTKSLTPKVKQQVAPPQVTDRANLYLLFEAAAIGDLESIKKSEYPYFDVGDYMKNTPLHVAASAGHLYVVKHLIEECKVSPFIRDKAMKRPVDVVKDQLALLVKDAGTNENLAQRRHFSMVNSYLDVKMENMITSTDKDNNSSFTKYEANVQIFMLLNKTYKGDIRSVRGYVDSDKSIINKTDYDKRTALHIAVAEKHEHLVIYFLEELKDIINTDIKDRWENTALENVGENEEILEIFKKNGYKVDANT